MKMNSTNEFERFLSKKSSLIRICIASNNLDFLDKSFINNHTLDFEKGIRRQIQIMSLSAIENLIPEFANVKKDYRKKCKDFPPEIDAIEAQNLIHRYDSILFSNAKLHFMLDDFYKSDYDILTIFKLYALSLKISKKSMQQFAQSNITKYFYAILSKYGIPRKAVVDYNDSVETMINKLFVAKSMNDCDIPLKHYIKLSDEEKSLLENCEQDFKENLYKEMHEYQLLQ